MVSKNILSSRFLPWSADQPDRWPNSNTDHNIYIVFMSLSVCGGKKHVYSMCTILGNKCYLDSLCVFLIKGANVKSICRIDFTLGWYQWRGILLQVHLSPVNALEEQEFLHLLGSERRFQCLQITSVDFNVLKTEEKKCDQKRKDNKVISWCSKIPPPPVVWLVWKIFPEDFNPHCDLDLEDSNQKLPQNAHDDAPLYHVWLQKVQKIQKKHFFFEDFSLHCDLDIEDRNPNFLHGTPGHDDTQHTKFHYKSGSEEIVRTNISPED